MVFSSVADENNGIFVGHIGRPTFSSAQVAAIKADENTYIILVSFGRRKYLFVSSIFVG
jgi:hypothetical protein